MAREIKIHLIGSKIDKPYAAQKRASQCIRGKCKISCLGANLPKQLFDDAPTLYLNPTEKMVFNDIINNSDPVSTVSGSGDFAIETSFHGVKDILTFDINSNQYYMAGLKLKGFQNMDYDEYWSFFSDINSPLWMSPEQYEKIKLRAETDHSLYSFFNEVMKIRAFEDRRRARYIANNPYLRAVLAGEGALYTDHALSTFPDYQMSDVFRTIAGCSGIKDVGSYLENQESYKQAQKNVASANISFIKTDLIRLREMLIKYGYFSQNPDIRFQTFYLSNVPEFINGQLFVSAVQEQLMPMLTENGVIAYCCQGTSEELLNMPDSVLNNLKEQLVTASPVYQNVIGQQLVNSVEAYRTLRELAKVELVEYPTLCSGNGISDKDTYVYVKQK